MTDTSFSLKTLSDLAGGDAGRLARLIAAFNSTANGAVASLDAALATGDVVEARRVGHKLKSSAQWIGAHRLAQLAVAIEALPADASMADATALVTALKIANDEVAAVLAGQPQP